MHYVGRVRVEQRDKLIKKSCSARGCQNGAVIGSGNGEASPKITLLRGTRGQNAALNSARRQQRYQRAGVNLAAVTLWVEAPTNMQYQWRITNLQCQPRLPQSTDSGYALRQYAGDHPLHARSGRPLPTLMPYGR